MTLLLVRHAESAGNVRAIIQGWRDEPLTPAGEAQAEIVAARLAGAGASALYSSPLLRTRHTAERIAAATGLSISQEPDLREYRFGEAEGMTWPEAVARWNLEGRDWGRGKVPGEEGMAAFRARVGARLDALAAQHANDAAICVIHGGVLGAFVAHLFGLAPDQHPRVHSGNCGVTTIEWEQGQAVLRRLNDCCHLGQGEATTTPGWQQP